MHHLGTYIVDNVRGTRLAAELEQSATQEAQIAPLLGSDWSNVNKTVWNIMKQTMLDVDKPGFVDVRSCNLHLVTEIERASNCRGYNQANRN